MALFICAVGIVLGAVTGGGEVVKPSVQVSYLKTAVSRISYYHSGCCNAVTLFANLIGIPLSTSEVTVGSVVGVGVAYQSLYVEKLLIVMSFWIIVPLVSFVIAF